MSLVIAEVPLARSATEQGCDTWFLSCVVCGLAVGRDPAVGLAAIAARSRQWRCEHCGGTDARFVWAGP